MEPILANNISGRIFPKWKSWMDGFSDGTFSCWIFAPNSCGLYDMIGNVWGTNGRLVRALNMLRLQRQSSKARCRMNQCYNPDSIRMLREQCNQRVAFTSVPLIIVWIWALLAPYRDSLLVVAHSNVRASDWLKKLQANKIHYRWTEIIA